MQSPNGNIQRPPRSGSSRLVLAGALAAGMLLVVVGVFVFRRGAPVASPDVGKPVADAFLASLQQGRIDAAWESTSAEFKSDKGRDSFRAFLRANPVIAGPLEFSAYEDASLHGVKRAQFVFRSPAAAAPASVRIVVGREGSEWKVDGVFVE